MKNHKTPSSAVSAGKAPQYHNTKTAAAMLDTTEPALRARLRRSARLEDGNVVSRPGMGIVGRKFGSTWLVMFTDE